VLCSKSTQNFPKRLQRPFKMELQIDKLVKYLMPFKKFINCHMVAYFTENHWENFITSEIQSELNDNLPMAVENLMDNGYDIESHPALRKFIIDSKSHTLPEMPELCWAFDKFREKVVTPTETSLTIKEFMSAKKCHEVEILSNLVYDLCKNEKNLAIIDAGDGKGYLSSRMALEFKLPVLGIDASQVNTHGAEKRSEKLKRAWDALVTRAEKVKNGEEISRVGRRKREKQNKDEKPDTPQLYQTVTQFIDDTTDLKGLMKERFPNDDFDSFCLTGLHTCGNLAPNCLNIFVQNPEIKLMCNVGCCYHLLTEPDNFPLSNYLKSKNVDLGRNARMLAAQSVPRFFHEKEAPQISLLYRAMLEVILTKEVPDEVRKEITVGKIKCKNFPEYVEKCFRKFGLKEVSLDTIEEVQMQYENLWDQMKMFYLIRIFFAPVVESLILLDRLLYLRESGFSQSYLVQLFDPVISPRCYGIIVKR